VWVYLLELDLMLGYWVARRVKDEEASARRAIVYGADEGLSGVPGLRNRETVAAMGSMWPTIAEDPGDEEKRWFSCCLSRVSMDLESKMQNLG